ncbi:MAG: nucleoside hydrolase [Clostridia bacterium]|nr:nucleoside hydrolase [Clostridia bacterium]
MTLEQYYKNLRVPGGKVDAVLDTDAYNEIDDQFALTYMLLAKERINTLGICAAPFKNNRSESAADGMNKSYDEIIKVLDLMGEHDMKSKVYRGSEIFMKNENEPVISDAAEYIAREAAAHTPEAPLYVVALGAITNVASAILINREAMRENTVIVWLGGPSHNWVDSREFNMMQDVAAARIVFGCGAPLVQLPCQGVVSEFRTTRPELEFWLKGTNPIGDYLVRNAINEAESYAAGKAWSRCIWDVTAVAWLLNDKDRFMGSYLTPAPIPEYDHRYGFDPRRHMIRYVFRINRDALFTDLFARIAGHNK